MLKWNIYECTIIFDINSCKKNIFIYIIFHYFFHNIS